MTDRVALTAQLERQYCPPLDPPTLLAILSDYDVAKEDDFKAVQLILRSLTEGADEEEASGFDPSGSNGLEVHKSPGGCESDSGHSSIPGWSSNTDNTSMSQGISALDLEGLNISDILGGVNPETEGQDAITSDLYNAQLEELDFATKEAVLIETFPGLKPFDIKWTLNKCKGNAGIAIDELLHTVFLEETGGRQRGIEAFSESDLPERRRERKGKKKRSRLTSEASRNSASEVLGGLTESKWDSGRRDIEFITSKTGIPMTQVSSIYHLHGGSVPSTINVIIDSHLSLALVPTDPMIEINASNLSGEFPSIPAARALALVEITHPSTAAAHELAKALVAHSSRRKSPVQIEVRLSPPDLDDSVIKPKTYNAAFTTPAPASPIDPDYVALRNTAFTQARAAHRVAKSNPLMGGAVSYYSQLGRDYSVRVAAQTSAAADAHVASQSNRSTLDLHGVNVRDAVRIAREGTTAWWASNGRVEPGAGLAGYRIITGKGTHSEGGKSRLGPAVGGMLIREGWRVQIGSGAMVVTGVVPKRR